MAPRILVVDHNQAFATMLEQMLSTDGGYDVQVAHTSDNALTLLRGEDYDLTILDMDLGPAGTEYQELIQRVREIRPTMRLMLIPLMGQELSPEASQLDIQGTLSKPFFVDDLLPGIEEALSREVGSPDLEPSTPENSVGTNSTLPNGESISGIQDVLSDLARETTADTVLLLSTRPDREGVITQLSNLNAEGVTTLASLVLSTIRAAQEAAHFLGRDDLPFEHNMFEGEGVRLYIMVLPSDLLLAVVTPLSTPLGTIRHNLRRAGRELVASTLT